MYIVFFALGFFLGGTVFADASGVNVNNSAWAYPVYINGYDTYTYTFSSNDITQLQNTNISEVTIYYYIAEWSHTFGATYSIDGQTPISFSGSPFYSVNALTIPVDWSFDENTTHTINFNPSCTYNNCSVYSVNESGTNMAYILSGQTTGGIGFIDTNDITPTDMIASVRTGVTGTFGSMTWIFIFVGVQIAFALIALLNYFISDTVEPQKTRRKRRKKSIPVM